MFLSITLLLPDTFKLFPYLSVKSKLKELRAHKAVLVKNSVPNIVVYNIYCLIYTNKYKRNFHKKLYCSFREECKQSFFWAAQRVFTFLPETEEQSIFLRVPVIFLDIKQREECTEIY